MKFIQDAQEDFIGRAAELNQLIYFFEQAKQGKSQFVILEGDTGIGKTRLIQELYHYLTIQDDKPNYWPDVLEDKKHTMTIVPEFDTLTDEDQNEMPWLWLAMRCQNKDERNSKAYHSSLSQLKKQIRLHLGGIIDQKTKHNDNINLVKSSVSLLANYAFPGSGALIGIIASIFEALDQGIGIHDSLRKLWGYWIGNHSSPPDHKQQTDIHESHSLIDQTFDIFSAIFSGKKAIPVILVVDDAQWIDPLTYRFLTRLYIQAQENKWPLFVITTCWEESLKEQLSVIQNDYEDNQLDENFATLVYSLAQLNENNQSYIRPQIMNLSKLNDPEMIRIIDLELKTLPDKAKQILVHNSSGDIELLWEFLQRIKNTPGYLKQDGTLNVPLNRLHFRSSRKKEFAREKILELGKSISSLIVWGSAQGFMFSKSFILQCVQCFQNHFQVNQEDFMKLDNPYNLTLNKEHPIFIETAEFRRRVYFEVAKEILDDLPIKDEIKQLLKQYYIELIESKHIYSLENHEQILIYEEVLYLSEELKADEHTSEINASTGIRLVELCLQEGLFDKCMNIGGKLLQNKEKLLDIQYKHLLELLIEAAFGDGNAELEETYIELYSNTLSNSLDISKDSRSYLNQSKYQLRCFHTDQAIQLAEQAIVHLDKNDNEYLRYKCYEQLVKSHFYAGHTEIGFRMLSEMEKKFEIFLRENERVLASYHHTVALLCHNTDLNTKVVEASHLCSVNYHQLHDQYNHMIARVNLADGLMGLGKLEEAEREIQSVYEVAAKTNWKHAQNIVALCYGNILVMENRLSEALHFYEEGIAISKKINHQWDLLYGQTWRAFCLAHFGEPTAFETLQRIQKESEQRGYHYLAALAASFAVITAMLTQHKDLDQIQTVLESIEKHLTPGLYAQALAAFSLLTNDKSEDTLEEILTYTLECEGMKGKPEIIAQLVEKQIATLKEKIPDLLNQFTRWADLYVKPIQGFQQQRTDHLKKEYHSPPKIKSCNFSCEAICCYDGAYLNKGEEEIIKEAVQTYPNYFGHLPTEFIVDGNWYDVMEGRKTASKPHQYQTPSFPEHFEKTRCVFAYESGLCSLQKVATDMDLHPWKFKPKACWAFPLTLENGQICGPPSSQKDDPDNIGEHYPGYTSLVPCGRSDQSGRDWYEVYKQEIQLLEKRKKK